jgi:hypothetical protein
LKNSFYHYDYLILNRLVKLIFKLKLEKFFMPFFRVWYYFLYGGKLVDNKTLIANMTDRYLSPVVHFIKLRGKGGLLEWVKEKNLKLIKISYTSRKSVVSLLIKKLHD